MPQSPQALFRKAQALEGPLSSEDLATKVKEPMETFCVLFGSYIILKRLHLSHLRGKSICIYIYMLYITVSHSCESFQT